MAKRFSLLAFFALGLLLYLIWKDPNSAATTVGDFLNNVGDFLSQVWHKLGDFFGNLAGSK